MENVDPVTCVSGIVLAVLAISFPLRGWLQNRRARIKTDKYLKNRDWKGNVKD